MNAGSFSDPADGAPGLRSGGRCADQLELPRGAGGGELSDERALHVPPAVGPGAQRAGASPRRDGRRERGRRAPADAAPAPEGGHRDRTAHLPEPVVDRALPERALPAGDARLLRGPRRARRRRLRRDDDGRRRGARDQHRRRPRVAASRHRAPAAPPARPRGAAPLGSAPHLGGAGVERAARRSCTASSVSCRRGSARTTTPR